MTPSKKCLDLIKSFEGLSLKAYRDPINIVTIGYGSVRNPDGSRVKIGDVLTQAQAAEYLKHEVAAFADGINALGLPINQSQFDSLTSFAYNLGLGNLKKSTLLRKIRSNPNDPAIRAEFLKWDKAGGQKLRGLTRRREAEASLYFS